MVTREQFIIFCIGS